jgi:type I restriction enzyme S subunit
LGSIPEDWQVLPLRELLSEPPMAGTSPAETVPNPPGTPTLNVSCIRAGRCALSECTFIQVGRETVDRYQVRRGDFFVLRGNGNVELVASGGWLLDTPTNPTIFSDLLIRLRFNDRVQEGFIPWLWQSERFKHRLQSKAKTGSGLWKIGQRDIRRELIPIPRLPEQSQIVDALGHSQKNLEAVEARLRALERLRRSLLQNLLTGRVRLTEAVSA